MAAVKGEGRVCPNANIHHFVRLGLPDNSACFQHKQVSQVFTQGMTRGKVEMRTAQHPKYVHLLRTT
ncbi:unnamed protein product [Knipowitschia caucasica]|uniref:Ribosomal protein S10 n=1 Tax=Knipowitschia caucasica TaxID=637954 RepID=A0AAV2MD21_KNICA